MAEPKPLSLPRPARSRRTQAERTAETRARILGATVESILEVGLARTTAKEIGLRAGVTWGAVQHHFGSKNGILAAVLEESFNRFASGLVSSFESLGEDAPLEARIDAFVDSAWEYYRASYFRAAFEILLEDSVARRSGESIADDAAPDWQAELLEAWTGIWFRLFPEFEPGARTTRVLQRYTISTLSGLASIGQLGTRGEADLEAEIAILKRTLAAEFERAHPAGTD